MGLKTISNRILPKQIDDNYTGHILSQYVFIVFTLLTICRSLAHMFLPDGGSESIASINISAEGGSNIISIFYLWGLSQLIIGIVYLAVILRYKSLIPLMWIIVFFEYLGRFLVGFYKPVVTMETAPGDIGNYIFMPLALIMLYLSLREWIFIYQLD